MLVDLPIERFVLHSKNYTIVSIKVNDPVLLATFRSGAKDIDAACTDVFDLRDDDVYHF